MNAARAFVALILVGFLGAWLTSAPTTVPRPPTPAVRAPTTTLWVAPPTTAPPTTTTTVAPPPRASRADIHRRPPLDDATRARVIAAIYSYGDWNPELMVRVGGCESGLNPYAVNGRHHNVFQIAGATLGLIEEHVALAHQMWVNRGMQPWLASRTCWS